MRTGSMVTGCTGVRRWGRGPDSAGPRAEGRRVQPGEWLRREGCGDCRRGDQVGACRPGPWSGPFSTPGSDDPGAAGTEDPRKPIGTDGIWHVKCTCRFFLRFETRPSPPRERDPTSPPRRDPSLPPQGRDAARRSRTPRAARVWTAPWPSAGVSAPQRHCCWRVVVEAPQVMPEQPVIQLLDAPQAATLPCQPVFVVHTHTAPEQEPLLVYRLLALPSQL